MRILVILLSSFFFTSILNETKIDRFLKRALTQDLNQLPIDNDDPGSPVKRNQTVKRKRVLLSPESKAKKKLTRKKYQTQFTIAAVTEKLSQLKEREEHDEFVKKLNKFKIRNQRSSKTWMEKLKERILNGKITENDKEYLKRKSEWDKKRYKEKKGYITDQSTSLKNL